MIILYLYYVLHINIVAMVTGVINYIIFQYYRTVNYYFFIKKIDKYVKLVYFYSGTTLFEIFNSLDLNPNFGGKLNFEVQVCHRHEHCPKLHIRPAR